MKSSSFATCTTSAALLLLSTIALVGAYSANRRPHPRTCSEAGLCCPGQNNTCFVFGARVDKSESSHRCYCDSNCLIMGDCCLDYHHHCRSVDCTVGEWGEWSECDNQCGYGTKRRYRDVTTHPDNGGTHCPILKERRACAGFNKKTCEDNRIHNQVEEATERARILPIRFGRFRSMKKYDPWQGILKNLYNKYFNEILTRPTYRAEFRITSTRHGCEKSEWAHVLKMNASVCAECQPVAMNKNIGMRCLGHGVKNVNTNWKAVDVPHCHGTWIQSERTDGICEYSVEHENANNFIFL